MLEAIGVGDVGSLLGSGVIGTLLGGTFRLVPEVIKWLDRKNERAHELAMFQEQCKLEQLRGDQKLAEIGAKRNLSVDTGTVAAFKSLIDQQTEMVKAAGGRVAKLSASVRPVVTYYLLAGYGVVKLGIAIAAMISKDPVLSVMAKLWTNDDMALLCGVLNYWFMDRTLMKRGLA